MSAIAPARHRRQHGLTYVESLLAVLLLGVCLAPAMQAITDILARENRMPDTKRNLECVREAMEKTLTERYPKLVAAAVSKHVDGTFSNPTSYSLAPTASCPQQRNVYILRYQPGLTDPFSSTSDNMLYIRTEQAETAPMATLAVKPK